MHRNVLVIMHAYIHAYTLSHIHVFQKRTFMHNYTYILVYRHIRKHKFVETCLSVLSSYVCLYMHIHVNIYAHIYTHRCYTCIYLSIYRGNIPDIGRVDNFLPSFGMRVCMHNANGLTLSFTL